MTPEQEKKFDAKMCHMKVMTDRVQNYNKVNFVPKSKQGATEPPMPPSELNLEQYEALKKITEEAGVPEPTKTSDPKTGEVKEVREEEPLMPSKIMENLVDSNVGEMFRNMSVNEQMKLIHNIMENEQWKKEKRDAVRQAQEEKAGLEA